MATIKRPRTTPTEGSASELAAVNPSEGQKEGGSIVSITLSIDALSATVDLDELHSPIVNGSQS